MSKNRYLRKLRKINDDFEKLNLIKSLLFFFLNFFRYRKNLFLFFIKKKLRFSK